MSPNGRLLRMWPGVPTRSGQSAERYGGHQLRHWVAKPINHGGAGGLHAIQRQLRPEGGAGQVSRRRAHAARPFACEFRRNGGEGGAPRRLSRKINSARPMTGGSGRRRSPKIAAFSKGLGLCGGGGGGVAARPSASGFRTRAIDPPALHLPAPLPVCVWGYVWIWAIKFLFTGWLTHFD